MAATAPLKFLTVAAKAKHTATVIFVHGLGDSGAGWKPVAEMLGQDPKLRHVKWILPHAPSIPVTANFGMEMPSWFDIANFDWKPPEDEQGMNKTANLLRQLIADEVKEGIPSERIVLGGFSQGGAMTLLTSLTTEKKFGGLVVLSAWLPLAQKWASDPAAVKNTSFTKTPLFWAHGEADPLIPIAIAKRSTEAVKSTLGVTDATKDSLVGLTFRTYPGMQHSTCMEELTHLLEWLGSVVPPETS
ncbi:hypothetical protein EIP91_004822 [Steccherinum ochraceum]|uniref:Acyl-protein thioesterase 1 n=1 Tax=Steccherinum ochraceum TaxID=92696 RepID=A0A4R0R8S9_9APHY|nr:hypothetical protein EIP91_004822 [Steccherinum ochraceum]